MPALLTLQVLLTFQGEAGFPQLHSWRPKVIQGKAAARGQKMCRSSDWGRKSARLELGETLRRASQRLTRIQTHWWRNVFPHSHIHTGVRTVRTDSCRDVIQAAHTNAHTLSLSNVFPVWYEEWLSPERWQSKHGKKDTEPCCLYLTACSLSLSILLSRSLFSLPLCIFHPRYIIHFSQPGPPPFFYHSAFICVSFRSCLSDSLSFYWA